MGLHLIAPKHSAYTAYLDESIAALLPFRKVPAVFEWSDGLHELFRGADWWEPDEEAAADCLRRAITRGDTGLNLGARARMVGQYTWEKAARRLLEILEELDSNRSGGSGIRDALLGRLWPFG
jgi:glycosyltransferase involved in cell wall biosynthesis